MANLLTPLEKRPSGSMMGAGIALCVLSRLIPHPPNMTALTSYSLLAGRLFPQSSAYGTVLLALILSDCVLSLGYQTLLWGSYTFFTYTGFLFITFLGKKIQAQGIHLFILLFMSSIFYWVWTNAGVFFFSTFYAKTWRGLSLCYTLALPFLEKSLWGDNLWMLIFLMTFKYRYHCVPLSNRLQK